MSSEAMNFWISFVSFYVLGVVNYILTSLAVYKIAKVQNEKNPWLAWIPVANQYLLIKVANGKMIFIILAIANLVAGGAAASMGQNAITTLLQAGWLIYSLVMYNRLCNRYDVSILLFVCGVIAPLFQLVQSLAGLYIPLLIVSFFGQWKLYKNASNSNNSKLRIESKVVFSKKK